MSLDLPPNPRLQRTRLRSPLSRQPLGRPGVRPTILVSVFLLGAVLYGCNFDLGGWYREASIDPVTSRMIMHGRVDTRGESDGAVFRDDLIQAGHIIEHLDRTTKDGKRPRLDFFFTDRKYRLIYREKDQELLRGEFGSVYAKSTYYYDSIYKGQATGFEVSGYSKGKGSESPVTADPPPESRARLVAISLVRVVRAHPGLAIFSATYSPDGQLQSLSADAARGGDWVGGNELVGSDPPINGGIAFGSGIALRPWYGIPQTFQVEDYMANPRVVWPTSGYPEEFAVVHLHYDRNRWVRQDKYVSGIRAASRYLHFAFTAQDQMLEPVDRRRGFG